MDESILCNLVESWLYLHMKGRCTVPVKLQLPLWTPMTSSTATAKKKKGVSLQLSLPCLNFFSEGGKHNINAAHWLYIGHIGVFIYQQTIDCL